LITVYLTDGHGPFKPWIISTTSQKSRKRGRAGDYWLAGDQLEADGGNAPWLGITLPVVISFVGLALA